MGLAGGMQSPTLPPSLWAYGTGSLAFVGTADALCPVFFYDSILMAYPVRSVIFHSSPFKAANLTNEFNSPYRKTDNKQRISTKQQHLSWQPPFSLIPQASAGPKDSRKCRVANKKGEKGARRKEKEQYQARTFAMEDQRKRWGTRESKVESQGSSNSEREKKSRGR